MFTDEELYGTANVGTDSGKTPDNQASTSEQSPDRQTETKTESQAQTPVVEKKKVNLQEYDEFKEYQSKTDQRYETLRQQALRKEQEMAARLAQYEQQLEQLATKDLDDVGKTQYENQKLKRILGAFEQQKQAEAGRQRIISMIRESTSGADVPESVYADAQDADDAWSKVTKYLMTNAVTQKAAALVEKKEANQVDLGGGTPSSLGDDLQRKYNAAMKAFNTRLVLDIMEEADAKGIKLQF